ncbi:HDOD domain-containing protein [Marinomonas atlantica]|uniref:HDOD domain-containing protein n=1 Tax=Marinomonas atlantica TaxID=1806668 RepID=UPI0008308E16|nr:HDOD domain-containing protein [Marinomonas atlantica]
MSEQSIETNTSTRVRIVHLADHTGKLQVIFPYDSMLDMAALSRLTKRRFDPVANYNIEGDPLVKPNACSTIIDSSLLISEAIELRSSATQSYKSYTQEEFTSRFRGPLARYEHIAIPVDKIGRPVEDLTQDAAQMQSALGKFQSMRLQQRLEETLEVPPLPASSHRIIQLCSNENAGTDDLCDVISIDPSLSAQVISWASSPYYGVQGEIDSVEDAIIRVLGFDMVMNLALGLSMGSAFQLPKNGPRHYEDFWFNAVSHAVLMEELVRKMPSGGRPRLGHAYLSGLLHNFGYLAIAVVLPPHFGILSRYIEANAHLASDIIEMQTLNFTKEQLGAWLLKHWGLPESIYTAVRYSKTTNYEGQYSKLAHLLQLCHQLFNDEPLDESILKTLSLSADEAKHCHNKVISSSSELTKMVDLISGSK